MSQFLIRADKHETYMQVDGHKGWWPRDKNRQDDPEYNLPFDVSLQTLRCEGDIDESVIRGVLACTTENFKELAHEPRTPRTTGSPEVEWILRCADPRRA